MSDYVTITVEATFETDSEAYKKAFEELDKIKEQYQNAIDIIFKIFFSRMD